MTANSLTDQERLHLEEAIAIAFNPPTGWRGRAIRLLDEGDSPALVVAGPRVLVKTVFIWHRREADIHALSGCPTEWMVEEPKPRAGSD